MVDRKRPVHLTRNRCRPTIGAMAIATRTAPSSTEQRLWRHLLSIAERRREMAAAQRTAAAAQREAAAAQREATTAQRADLQPAGQLIDASLAQAAIRVDEPELRDLVSLYRPLLTVPPGRRYVSAHLGQSIDGLIATRDGQSRGLNGCQNLDHLHRMRALSDAIVVGAGTVLADDPALTTRRVEGRHPVRVILDGRGRIDARYRVCHDGEAPTLILTGRADAPTQIGQAEVVRLPRDPRGHLLVPAIFDCLAGRGLDVAFIEGGGVTVSRLLEAGVLDRLQITIAPVVFGEGVKGLSLAGIGCVDEALRPPVRQFTLGPDRLWDFTLTA